MMERKQDREWKKPQENLSPVSKSPCGFERASHPSLGPQFANLQNRADGGQKSPEACTPPLPQLSCQEPSQAETPRRSWRSPQQEILPLEPVSSRNTRCSQSLEMLTIELLARRSSRGHRPNLTLRARGAEGVSALSGG